jgi:long-chain acyl-CoA synthetase
MSGHDSRVIAALYRHAAESPGSIALVGGDQRVDYASLLDAVKQLAAGLRASRGTRVGIVADNGIAWALSDLAVLHAGLVSVPLPLFFSAQQIAHAIADAGLDLLLIDRRLALPMALPGARDVSELLPPATASLLQLLSVPAQARPLHAATRKITYTSGTTGSPKGVCLGIEQQERVAEALVQASGANAQSQHLCVLPLATLLENIGGLYAPLLVGATTHVPSLGAVGLDGASGFDPARLLKQIELAHANSVILVPQLLLALVAAIEARAPLPKSLSFVAVGGAMVSPTLLGRAIRSGLPVYEGYGLSECASVVALNTIHDWRAGTVGRPLPHLRLRIAPDGEVWVSGNGYLGYVGEPAHESNTEVATGDIGHLDEDGFLHLTGRKKNIFVTAYGRNVSPEWVESELALQPAIAQAAVFGEARPYNVAVIVPRTREPAALQAALDAVNRGLPDYARIHRWIVASQPFAPANDQLTPNGRLRRSAIASAYRLQLESLYDETAA